MRGLDPRIHAAVPSARQFSMDRRVKPGGDEAGDAARIDLLTSAVPYSPHPEEPAQRASRRIRVRIAADSWFETRGFAALLTMRRVLLTWA